MSKTVESIRNLLDEKGQIHCIEGKLAAGGQGVVLKTKDKNILIKLALKRDKNGIPLEEIEIDEKVYNKFKNRIDKIRMLNLPSFLPIAKPGVMLEAPYSGYVLRMLTGMEPIENIIRPKPDEKLASFYLRTGGLRRRLYLLLKLAKIFSEIESLGIIYADISHGNIFVSSDSKSSEVWLIDPDNMRYSLDFTTGGLFTPGYGAPELFKGGVNTIFSDRYSFAILAFYVLGLNHPFKGKMVTDPEDDDDAWDATVETGNNESENRDFKAERGDYPWIDDEADDRNRSDSGIPRRFVLSPNMKALFQKAFGEHGKNNPSSRPTARDWYEVLKKAHDAVLRCTSCGGSYYFTEDLCPFCREPKKIYHRAKIYDYFSIKELLKNDLVEFPEEVSDECKKNIEGIPFKAMHKLIGRKVFEKSEEEQFFMKYHTEDSVIGEDMHKTISLKIDEYDIELRNLGQKNIEVLWENGSELLREGSRLRLPSDSRIFIRIHLNSEKSRCIEISRVEV